jgi:hypothetical protein
MIDANIVDIDLFSILFGSAEEISEFNFNIEKDKFEYEKVKTLFDYTKFHIGVYISLGTILAAALNSSSSYLPHRRFSVAIAIIFTAAAGLAGGTIATTLPECSSLDQFFEMKFAPLEMNSLSLSGRWWTRVEHTMFWIGIMFGFGAFIFPPRTCHTSWHDVIYYIVFFSISALILYMLWISDEGPLLAGSTTLSIPVSTPN